MENQPDPAVLQTIFGTEVRRVSSDKIYETGYEPAQPTKTSEENMKILQIFDVRLYYFFYSTTNLHLIVSYRNNRKTYDVEQNKELDVYQLKKYFEKEWKVCLPEEAIKYHCGQTFLEKAYKVQRHEFVAFHKYVAANKNEIQSEKIQNIFEGFEAQFSESSSLEAEYKYLDKNIIVSKEDPIPHSLLFPQPKEPVSTDKIHTNPYNMFFGKTFTRFVRQEKYTSIFDGRKGKEMKSEGKVDDRLFGVESLVQTETVKPGTRRKQKSNLFEYFNPKLTAGDLLYSTKLTNAQNECVNETLKVYRPLVIEVTKIRFNIYPEPLQLRFSFYDMDFCKMTADFTFDISASMLKDHIENNKPLRIPKTSAIIKKSFLDGKENIFVVLQIFKPMDVDVDLGRDAYCAEGKKDQKMVKKYIEKVKESKNLENKKFYQLLLIGGGSIHYMENYEMNIYKPTSDLKDIYSLIREMERLKICGNFEFSLRNESEKYEHCDGLTKVYQPNKSNMVERIKMMTNIDLTHIEETFNSYENKLFVYPTEVVLSKERKKSGIVITVYVRETDDRFVVGKSCLSVVYPNTSGTDDELCSSFTTSVSNDKNGHFTDEIKIELPFPLNEKHHLLFQIRDINTEDGTEGKSYYGIMMLYENNEIIRTKEHTIPILKEMVDGYLEEVEYYDISNMNLKVNINVVSSIYPLEQEISNFIYTKTSVETVVDAEFYPDFIHFLPLVMKRVVNILEERNREELFGLFRIFRIMDKNRTDDGNERCMLYKNSNIVYAINHFVPIKTEKGNYPCQFLIFCMPILFDKTETEAKERLKYMWIIFSIYLKSLIGFYQENGVFELKNYHEYFKTETGYKLAFNTFKHINMFSEFIVYCSTENLASEISIREANLFYAEFIRDFSCLFKRGEVTRLIDTHLDNLIAIEKNPNGMIDSFSHLLRLEFVAVLAEDEKVYTINGPQVLEIKEINKLNDLLAERHAMMYIILRQFFLLIMNNNKNISRLALHELVIVMNKIDLDVNYNKNQKQNERNKIFSMLFPFVLFMLDESDKLNEWREKDSYSDLYDIETLYVIFFFILKNLRDTLIDQWLVSDFLPSLLYTLLSHIRKALLLFTNFPMIFIPNSRGIYLKELLLLFNRYNSSLSQVRTATTPIISSPMRTPGPSKSFSRLGNFATKRFSSKLKSSMKEEHSPSSFESNPRTSITNDSEDSSVFSKLKDEAENQTNLAKSDMKVEFLILEILLISMDYSEVMMKVLLTEEPTPALERVQELVSVEFFTCKKSRLFLVSIYDFIRSIVSFHRNFIFTRQNLLTKNLVKRFLELSNSDESAERSVGNNLILFFCKMNFTVTGNTISTVVNATNALSELQLNEVKNVKTLITQLGSLYQQYNLCFDTRLSKCVDLLLEEGIRRNKSLIMVHQIYDAIDSGDLDAFFIFVMDCILMYEGVLDLVLNSVPSVINGYVQMKSDIGALLASNRNFKMIENWISLISRKVERTCDVFKGFFGEKREVMVERYGMCCAKMRQLEEHCEVDKRDVFELVEGCRKNKEIGEQIIQWIVSNMKIETTEVDQVFELSENELILKIEELEGQQTLRCEEIKKLIVRYSKFDEILRVYQLEANPLFPITTEEITEGTKRVVTLHQSRIKNAHICLQSQTCYLSENERYARKIRKFETDLEQQYFEIQCDLCARPIGENFFNRAQEKYKMMLKTVKADLASLEAKKTKSGCLRPEWDVSFGSWEETINEVIGCVEWLSKYSGIVKENNTRIEQMKLWYEKERTFNIKVVDIYVWDGIYLALNKVAMKESNDYLGIMASVYRYLKETEDGVEKEYEECSNISKELLKEKECYKNTKNSVNFNMEALGFKLFEKVNSNDFEKLDMTVSIYVDQYLLEKELENKRNLYAQMYKEFFEITDTTKGTLDNEKVTRSTELSEKLFALDKEHVTKLNRYCKFETNEQTVLIRAQNIGINHDTCELKSPRISIIPFNRKTGGVALQQITQFSSRKGDDLLDIVGAFFDEKKCVKIDCFYDLSYGQRDSFSRCLTNVQTNIISIVENLDTLNSKKVQSTDTQYILELYYQFAMDYISAPQLHMTWMSKLAQQHRKKLQYVEAGLCEVHLVIYVNNLLPEDLRFDLKTIKDRLGTFARNSVGVVDSQFASNISVDTLIEHVNSACNDFEDGKYPVYGLLLANLVVPYYVSKKRYRELTAKHEYVNKMYEMMVAQNRDGVSGVLQFYYVRFFGTNIDKHLDGNSFVYSSSKERMSYLLKEVKETVPKNFKGETHILRTLDQVNDAVTNGPDDQYYIVWTPLNPVFENVRSKCCNKFYYDELKKNSQFEEKNFEGVDGWTVNRLIVETDFVLPGVMKRLQVVKETNVTLNAIAIMTEEIVRRKNEVFNFLDESKRSADNTTKVLEKLLNRIEIFVYGVKEVKIGKPNVFEGMNIMKVVKTFFNKYEVYHLEEYKTLFEQIKEGMNFVVEGIAVLEKVAISKEEFEGLQRVIARIDLMLDEVDARIDAFEQDNM
ncbi:hypothetical protein EIN_092070 [Entamoeba invadens IP1]|uniref:Dedicator of cytokinesis protein n=1 Tax=Entamoeba invadens IP1 TaxID=370355 RepID=A0A0A1U1Y3_ENTIV|nr:hypothetical protein EIN_092070 [Entamoeba invadens IP1]ELP86642.1 hypothetical protein EIN_092070 [Entamoeba invadens IP1]|eukprot:XP_004185988.1 hypothetical protein EIN_092070 [Entamoeba invadens IP1]